MAKGDVTSVNLEKDDSGNFMLKWSIDNSSRANQWDWTEHSKVFKSEESEVALTELLKIYRQKLKLK